VRRVLGIALVGLVVLAGCGGNADSSSSDESTEVVEVTETEVNEPVVEEATKAEALEYARASIRTLKTNLKEIGADLFGSPDVQCAATGGIEIECLVELPFRRLDDCGIAETTLFVSRVEGELDHEGGDVNTVEQICYIGENGEQVPERPGE